MSNLWVDQTNTSFASAWPLDPAGGVVHGNNVGAGAEPSEIKSDPNITDTVWFLYVAIATDPITFDTIGSGFDTILCTYHVTGGSPAVDGTDLADAGHNDDTVPTNQSSVTLTPAAIGDQYYLQVGGFEGNAGDYLLNYPAGGGAGPGPDVPPPPPPVDNAPQSFDGAELREFLALLSPADGVDETALPGLESFTSSDDFYIDRPPPPPPPAVSLDPVDGASAIDGIVPPGLIVLDPVDGASAIATLVLPGPVWVLLDELDGVTTVTVAPRFRGHVALAELLGSSSVSVAVSLPDSGVGSLTGFGETAVTENAPIRFGLFLTARAEVGITPETEDEPW